MGFIIQPIIRLVSSGHEFCVSTDRLTYGYLNRKSSETYGDTYESQPQFRVKLSKKEEEDEGNFGITSSSLGFGGFDSKRNQFEISYRDLHVDIIKLGMNYIR